MKILLLLVLTLNCTLFAEQKTVDKPTLYVFSSHSCPACYMMKPIVKKAQKTFAKKLTTEILINSTPKRSLLIREFMKKVEMRYVPVFVMADKHKNILAYAKGAFSEQEFFAMIETGLEKNSRLNTMKLTNLLFICRNDNKDCEKSEKELDLWMKQPGNEKYTLEKFDLASFSTEKQWQGFQKRMDELKFLYELGYVPALIAASDKDEVIRMIQGTEFYRPTITRPLLNQELKEYF